MAKQAVNALSQPSLGPAAKLRAETQFSVEAMRLGTSEVYRALIRT
jgi:hypothetical protein